MGSVLIVGMTGGGRASPNLSFRAEARRAAVEESLQRTSGAPCRAAGGAEVRRRVVTPRTLSHAAVSARKVNPSALTTLRIVSKPGVRSPERAL